MESGLRASINIRDNAVREKMVKVDVLEISGCILHGLDKDARCCASRAHKNFIAGGNAFEGILWRCYLIAQMGNDIAE
jgi:hypothetical protein